jgi:hypothetical protein
MECSNNTDTGRKLSGFKNKRNQHNLDNVICSFAFTFTVYGCKTYKLFKKWTTNFNFLDSALSF